MGYIKDIYDILTDEPEAREWLANEMWKIWQRSNVDPGEPEPTHLQKIEAEKAFAKSLRQDEFVMSFKDRLSFLMFVLARVYRAVVLKERGLVLTNFYCKGGSLYFPSHLPARLIRAKDKFGKSEMCGFFAHNSFTDKSEPKCIFYYIREDMISPSDLKQALDEIVTGHSKSEVEAIEKKVGKEFKQNAYAGVSKSFKNNSFKLEPFSSSVDRIQLNLTDPNEVRSAIADDLLHVLNWTGF